MKFTLIFFLLIASTSQAQLISGAAKNEGRVVTSETPFIIEGTIDGWATYELSIDRKGVVTGARILDTNLKRTSAKMQLRNYVMTMKFTPGTYYPKFHHAQVKVTLVKPSVEEETEESTE